MNARSVAAWLLLLFIGALGVARAQTAPDYSREQRLSRFHHFLNERKQALYAQGARSQVWSTPAGMYPDARLLDPREVTSHLAYAINRYDSYLARVQTQARSEDVPIRPAMFGAARPAGYFSPEDFDGRAGDPNYDATNELRRAVNAGPVWLTPGKTYVLSGVLHVPSFARIVSDGSATIWIKTGSNTAFTSLDTRSSFQDVWSDNQPIQISGKSDVVLRDFRLRMASESTDVQPLLRGGIQVNDSTNVRIEGLELLGFPRTLGILRVNSSRGVVLRDNLIHGSYTVIPTFQATGIEVDNDRVNGVYTSNLEIVGNFILGVMLDNGVVFRSDSRYTHRAAGGWLGYESDGITIAINNPNRILVEKNSVMDVGEGIDTYGSNGVYRNNHVERTFGFGIKLIHGASNNLLAGNKVLASGFSSIYIDNRTAPTGSNRFVRNRVRFTNAFNTQSLPVQMPRRDRVGAFEFAGYTTRNFFQLNEVSEPMFQEGAYVSGVYCTWPSPSAYADTNVLWKNTLTGFSTPYHVPNSECTLNRTSAPYLRSAEYQNWIADGVQLEFNVRYDHHFERATTDRAWANAAGIYEVRTGFSLSIWQDRDFTASSLVRRGSNTQIMMRDAHTDWYVIFNLTGDGTIAGSAGTMLRSASIVRLTDDWYFLAATFRATQPYPLLSLRQLNSGPDRYLDLGETRFDPEF